MLLARLFIDTLKGVAFEWFMKLPVGSTKIWADLEKLFLACFFENDTEISVPTLLTAKQKKGEYQNFVGPKALHSSFDDD